MCDLPETSNSGEMRVPDGVDDRIAGRESAHGLLVVMGAPDAEKYRQRYEQTDQAFQAAHDALDRRDIPPEPAEYGVISFDLTAAMYRRLRREARQRGLTVDEYLLTFFYPFLENLPSRRAS